MFHVRKRIELKCKVSHFKSQFYLDNEKTVINKYTIINPELGQINDISKKNVNKYNRRFNDYEIVCKWKLVFDYDISFVQSKVFYRITVLSQDLEKYLKNKINH